MSGAVEVNFDGLVGPTHHYGGLALGNLASSSHRHEVSRPRDAALEGLAKMRRLVELGVPQAVLPPQERPHMPTLRRLGFDGTDAQIVEAAERQAPGLLSACSSASSMWAANAATVSASADTSDGRLHVTPANLVGQLHRSIEAEQTRRVLRTLFADPERFCVHQPLPPQAHVADEGAANHMRLCAAHGERGLEVFVFGREDVEDRGSRQPRRFRGRQTLAASQAVARLHGLDERAVVFLRQSLGAIDAGVFHNDVIAVGHRNLLLYHKSAFAEADAVCQVAEAFERVCGESLATVCVAEGELSLEEAVATYLFNSQIVDAMDGRMVLVCPEEVRQSERARACVDRIVDGDNPIAAAECIDVRQSMRNGGGPACLRLRIVMTEAELAAAHRGVCADTTLLDALEAWVRRHYRRELRVQDLADRKLLVESRVALDELSRILGLGSIYHFQR